MWTSDEPWDPTVIDHNMEDDDQWFDAVTELTADPQRNLFDEFGNYRHRHVVQAGVSDLAFADPPSFMAVYKYQTLEAHPANSFPSIGATTTPSAPTLDGFLLT